MTTVRMPIIHDSSYPLGGLNARRHGARDADPVAARVALTDHLRTSMGQQNYTKACVLLNSLIAALLDAGESESGAMDARVLDHRPGELERMFPTSANPKLAPNAGARDPSAIDARVLDHRSGVLSELFADAPNPSTRNYR